MAKTQFIQKKQQFSYKRLLGALVALVVAFLLLASVINVAEKYIATRSHIRDLTLQQQTLLQKQDALAKTNAYIATPEGTEEILRQKYNVVKPGEGMIVIDDTPPALPAPESKVARWWKAILAGLGIERE